MTRIDELKQQIADLRTANENLNTKVATEKRVKTTEERSTFDTNMTKIQGLEAELKDVQLVERVKIEAPTIITSERREKNKRYDLSKGVQEYMRNSLSGLEAELHQEIARNYSGARGLLVPDEVIYKRTDTMVNSAGLIANQVSGLDILAVPALYQKLGATEFNNLTTTYTLNFTDGVKADKVAEGAAYSAKTFTYDYDTLEPNAFGHQVKVSGEALAVTSILASYLVDGDNAIGAKITMDLLAKILAESGCTLNGFAATDTASGMTSKFLNQLKSAVLSPLFRKPAYAMGSTIFGELEETQAATVLRTIINDGKINGFNAYDVMNLLEVHDTNMYDIIFGDWSRAFVGKWYQNAMEIIVDPFTSASTRDLIVTFNRLADTSFNPYAFKTIQNAKLA